MKYFTFIVFLLISVFVNAQMNMEEISYIPSHSGYYNNLVVKGNTKINEIVTYPFNVVSYGSFLTLNSSSKMHIGTVYVSTGTAALYSNFSVDDVAGWSIVVPGYEPERGTKVSTVQPIALRMDGGNLSLSRSGAAASLLKIDPITFEPASAKTPLLTIRTENFNYPVPSDIKFHAIVKNLYLFGMKVPSCTGGYYWQPVKAGGKLYYILACNTTTCVNPEYEEACLKKNNDSVGWSRYVWDVSEAPNNCYCRDTTQGVGVIIDDPAAS